MASPPAISNVKLLLHFDGTDGQTTTVDSSTYAQTVALAGGAQLSNDYPAFGTTGAEVYGSAQTVAITRTTDLDFSDGISGHYNVTVEFMFRLGAIGQYYYLLKPSSGLRGFWIEYTDAGYINVFHLNNDGVPYVSLSAYLPHDTSQHHLVYDTYGDTFSLYIDGVLQDTDTYSDVISNSSATYYVLGTNYTSTARVYIDEFRWTVGESVYEAAASITVPTSAFPDPEPPVTAVGALSASSSATIVGAGDVTRNATGALVQDDYVVTGVAHRQVTGTGALESQNASTTGLAFFVDTTGGVDVVAWGSGPSGPPQAGDATIVGVAERIIYASGVLEAGDHTTVATAYLNPSFAAGDLAVGFAAVSGAGSHGYYVSGALESLEAVVAGAGYWKPGYSVWELVFAYEDPLATGIVAAAVFEERVRISESLVNLLTWGAEDGVELTTALAASISSLSTLSEILTVADVLQVVAQMAVTETVTIDQDVPEGIYRLLTIVNRVLLTSTISQKQTVAVTASLLASALTVLASMDSVSDGVEASDVVAQAMEVAQWVAEGLTVTATVAPFLRVVLVGSDSLSLQSAITSQMTMTNDVTETVSFVGSLGMGDPEAGFTTWVVHPEIPAATTYNNFTFNSFATRGATMLAARADGIYELTGDTDADTDIAAVVRTGLMELGATLLKQVTRAYLGYTSDGRLVLKTITTDGGEKTERWYELEETAGAPREARIKFGKGVKARYWQFELRNADGADFHVDQLQLLPLALSRRVKE